MSSQLLFDYDAALALKTHGLDMAGWVSLTFVECMRDAARAICASKGSVTTDDLREIAQATGLTPNSDHAWGAIFHEKGWHSIGSEPSKLKTNRARWIRRWVWKP